MHYKHYTSQKGKYGPPSAKSTGSASRKYRCIRERLFKALFLWTIKTVLLQSLMLRRARVRSMFRTIGIVSDTSQIRSRRLNRAIRTDLRRWSPSSVSTEACAEIIIIASMLWFDIVLLIRCTRYFCIFVLYEWHCTSKTFRIRALCDNSIAIHYKHYTP